MFNKQATIETIVNICPKSVKYFMDKGIKCIECGEPIWDTLEEAVYEKGFNREELHSILSELNQICFPEDPKK
jgi:methionine synthase II (cobalamin-independent)